MDWEITKIPLPVNDHRNSSNGDGKLRSDRSSHAESNGGGGDLPRALSAADQSSKICKLSGDRSVILRRPRWSWLVGTCCWRCEEPVPSGGASQSGENNGDEIGFKPRLSSSNRRRSNHFSTTRTTWIRSSSLKLRIGTKLARNSGRKWENRSVKVTGSGRSNGSNLVNSFLSLSCLSGSLLHSLSLYIYIWGSTWSKTRGGVLQTSPFKEFRPRNSLVVMLTESEPQELLTIYTSLYRAKPITSRFRCATLISQKYIVLSNRITSPNGLA